MSRFTIRPEPEIDQNVEEDLARIVETIRQKGIDYYAVYLIGSFGRGEGTVYFNGSRWLAINDYDLVVVVDDCAKARLVLHQLGQELAR